MCPESAFFKADAPLGRCSTSSQAYTMLHPSDLISGTRAAPDQLRLVAYLYLAGPRKGATSLNWRQSCDLLQIWPRGAAYSLPGRTMMQH